MASGSVKNMPAPPSIIIQDFNFGSVAITNKSSSGCYWASKSITIPSGYTIAGVCHKYWDGSPYMYSVGIDGNSIEYISSWSFTIAHAHARVIFVKNN